MNAILACLAARCEDGENLILNYIEPNKILDNDGRFCIYILYSTYQLALSHE